MLLTFCPKKINKNMIFQLTKFFYYFKVKIIHTPCKQLMEWLIFHFLKHNNGKLLRNHIYSFGIPTTKFWRHQIHSWSSFYKFGNKVNYKLDTFFNKFQIF